mgnify:CR=1 FL=1
MIKLKAFLTSLLIHLLVFSGIVVLLRLNAESSAKYVEIDLSLTSLINSLQKSSEENKNLGFKNRENLTKLETKRIKEYFTPEPKEPILKENQPKNYLAENIESKELRNEEIYAEKNYEVTKSIAMIKGESLGIGSSLGTSSEANKGKGGGSGVGTEGKGDGVDLEKLKEKFLIEKLFIISKIVQNNITYPYIARKMGWEGKVVISFVLTKEGKINLLTVEKSSGYEVLDENAIKTIQKVSKYFPLPPIDVKIKLPISYKLN